MSHSSRPVVVADPDPQMRAVVASILAEAGMLDVVMAPSMEEAKDAIRTRKPSAVITEANLPDGDGVDLLTWIRRDPESPAPDAPVLVLTARVVPELVSRARNAGAHAVLAKPVTARSLLTKFGRALDDPRPFVNSDVYVGPCRRVKIVETPSGRARALGDDEPQNDPRLCDPAHCASLAAHVNALAECAHDLAPDGFVQLRVIRQSAEGMAQKAEASGDRPLAIAARSLRDFIDARQGAGRIDPEIVHIHVATMRNLTNPERRRSQNDRDVISGLHKLVARELKAA